MQCIKELLTLEPFQQLPREQLEWACDRADDRELPAGTLLIEEGVDPNAFFILLKGRVSMTRQSEGAEIDNAIDAMGDAGTLEIFTCRDGDYIRVEIIDSGAGIPAEIQSRIFEPFFTTKDMDKGLGLGLDVVGRIIRNRHQGVITVTSEPGRTCCTVCLPIPSKN